MENRIYVEPEFEVTMFDSSDVITTSGGGNMGGGIVLPDIDF